MDKKEGEEDAEHRNNGKTQGKKDMDGLDSDEDDDDLSDFGEEDDEEDFKSKTDNKTDVLPDVSQVNIKDWKQSLIPNELFKFHT